MYRSNWLKLELFIQQTTKYAKDVNKCWTKIYRFFFYFPLNARQTNFRENRMCIPKGILFIYLLYVEPGVASHRIVFPFSRNDEPKQRRISVDSFITADECMKRESSIDLLRVVWYFACAKGKWGTIYQVSENICCILLERDGVGTGFRCADRVSGGKWTLMYFLFIFVWFLLCNVYFLCLLNILTFFF